MTNIKCTLVLILFCTSFSVAQNLEEDIRNMQELYTMTKNFSANISIKVFEGEEEKKLVESRKAEIRKQGNEFFYKIGHLTILINKQFHLMINNKQKTILLDELSGPISLDWQKQLIPGIDSTLQQFEQINFIENKDGVKKYLLINKDKAIDKIELFLDADKYYLRKLIYQYNPAISGQDGYAIIDFEQVSTSPNTSASIFSEKRFIQRTGNRFKGADAFKDYEVINKTR